MNANSDKLTDIKFPDLIEIEGKVHDCKFEKRLIPEHREKVELKPFKQRMLAGLECQTKKLGKLLILPKRTLAALPDHKILISADGDSLLGAARRGDLTWLRPKPKKMSDLSLVDAGVVCERVRKSWRDTFSFTQEIRDSDGQVVKPGLRPPQIGALHAVLAHWSVSNRPATVVMPTGTGKTETMLALMTSAGIERLLVVVPNAALREQISEKFVSLGILKQAEVLLDSAETPVVGTLKGRPGSIEEVNKIFSRANVVVTTMQVVGQCQPQVQERMAELCSHLFIDEAHHIGARTWLAFRNKFEKKSVIQFTATPFRTDGRRVDGKFIYVYPLAKAQAEGYFRPIQFRGVQGLSRPQADREIIDQVGKQLCHDLENGMDHLAMARAGNIQRANELYALYEKLLPEFDPVLIHSGMKSSEKEDALTRLRRRTSKIIVCVDMLGEGFDLPQLKISGLHDRHKSIAITLQFTGRFTRDLKSVGDATVIANIEETDIDDALRTLYAEDADWNFLLNVLSETKTHRQLNRAKIMEGFTDSLEGIPLQTLIPKMNTVVYNTECEEWRPLEIEDALPQGIVRSGPIINDSERLAVFVTREESTVRWSTSKEVSDVEWNLYMLHWDAETKLLYINSSKSKELHEKLAKAVGGEKAARIRGESVYRVLDGMNRLMLMNLGLSSLLGRHVRYTMFVGSDITAQISDAQFTAKRKSNLFGVGYNGEGKRTVGCSAKGKFWSMQSAADFSEWLEWCHEVGSKVTDETISTDAFIRNLVTQTPITERPENKPVLAVHWPETFLINLEERILLRFGDAPSVGFFECEIQVDNHDPDGPIRFSVNSEEHIATFEIGITEDGASYTQVDGPDVFIKKGQEKLLSEVFADDPPHVYFADGDFLIFNELFSIPRDQERKAFNPDKITVKDWTGVDIKSESQGVEKRADSIQRKVIEELLLEDPEYDVIFDDDGCGEIADIVALREEDNCLYVNLFHLKYAHGAAPGNRVADLYEVCGQAQKSIRWMEYPVRILKRLRKRETDRVDSNLPSRFEKGDISVVRGLINRWKVMDRKYQVWVVQPGLSKKGIEPKQLDLLAATESFLLDTYGVPLKVIANE